MTTVETARQIEGSPCDVRLTHEASRETDDAIPAKVAVDGVEAISFARREYFHACAPRPDLILPALNLLKMEGRNFWRSGSSLRQRLRTA